MAGQQQRDLEKFPFYYPANAQFLLNGAPSGAQGAEARVVISVNNWPQVAVGIRVCMSYEIDDAVFAQLPTVYENLSRLDDQCSLEVILAQQNITARPMHLRLMQGRDGLIYHPLVSQYLWRGGNQITLILRRLVSYPVVFETNIIPTAHAALAVVVGVSDMLSGASPGSTGRP